MQSIRAARASLVLLAVIALCGDATADSTSSGELAAPTAQIDALHDSLLGVMKDAAELGYGGRAERLAPVIPRFFDVGFMAEKSVGRHWKNANDADRERFLATFLRFMVANYARQFDGFSGQSFETLGAEPARSDTVLVKSLLKNPAGGDVELNYRMREVDREWKIVDIYLDGTVSELALRRSEFAGIVKREQMAGLIAAIDKRIAALAARADS